MIVSRSVVGEKAAAFGRETERKPGGIVSRMGSVNKVMLVGNLGRDADLRYTPSGAAVATLNLATTEMWTDKAGQR